MKTPEKGFYYHYKHDPAKGFRDYAYEFLNPGLHTEIEDLEKSAMVAYRPLYEDAKVYKLGKFWDFRPLSMFMENVVKNEKTIPRFQKITDPEVISKLEKIRDDMYN